MITVIATLKVKSGQEDALIAGIRKMIDHVKANEPGTITYVLNRSTADPTTFLVYEVYADQAAFATHGASQPCWSSSGLAGSILDGRPDIAMYDEVARKR